MTNQKKYLKDLTNIKVLIIGDLILDKYIWAKVNKICPEAPIPIANVQDVSYKLGGAANVANNIKSLGGIPFICGTVEDDSKDTDILLNLLNQENISNNGLLKLPNRPTTVKTRIVAQRQHMLRIDKETTTSLDSWAIDRLHDKILKLLPKVNAIIIEDYGKGVVSDELLDTIIIEAKNKGKIIVVDPKETLYNCFKGATAITPNSTEAEYLTGISINNSKGYSREAINMSVKDLTTYLNCDIVLLTLGEYGMALYNTLNKNSETIILPTQAREIADVSGAGDTVTATFTLALASGVPVEQAAILANLAAGVAVEKLGTATVTRNDLIKAIVS